MSWIMNIVRPVSRIHLPCISPAIEQVLGQSFRRPFSSPRPPLVPILSSVPDLTVSHISPRRGTPSCAAASLRYRRCIHTCITAQQVPQPPLPGYVTALREQHFPATESGFLTILDRGIILASPIPFLPSPPRSPPPLLTDISKLVCNLPPNSQLPGSQSVFSQPPNW